MRRAALAGYPIGLTIAPIMPIPDWRDHYDRLLADAQDALADIPGLDLTAELITHRFTPSSRATLLDWYPGTALDMEEAARTRKTTKFGGAKYVYPPETMTELRGFLERRIADRLPEARILYWT
jgi:spore photoproduct lyase